MKETLKRVKEEIIKGLETQVVMRLFCFKREQRTRKGYCMRTASATRTKNESANFISDDCRKYVESDGLGR